ncbi:MAG: radical SAM protein [Terriglobia bacterium]
MLAELCLKPEGRQILFNLKPSSFSLSLDGSEVYSFDLLGKLLSFWDEGGTYIRTLDNRLIRKKRRSSSSGSWKEIQELGKAAKRAFVEKTCQRLGNILHSLEYEEVEAMGEMEQSAEILREVRKRIKLAVGWDFVRLENERNRFRAVYTPVTILPPDQYLALVVQVTEGCHWNHCTFCHFYRKTSFRIKSEEEFGKHLQSVKDFFGEAIRLRGTIFLGDANALVLPQPKLIKVMDQLNRIFPIGTTTSAGRDPHAFRGVYSFMDVFTGERKTEKDFAELRERNLRRVYVGVETGCDALLSFLNKPATTKQTLDVCTTVKGAGLGLGVIVMIGIGGRRFLHQHIEQTAELLNQMGLGPGDMIYFSPFEESTSTEYSLRAAEAGIVSLTDAEREFQLNAIRGALKYEGLQKPKISLYDIREFVY